MDPYSLGTVNVDSLKESLFLLSSTYPFADETAKDAFTAQVNGLDSAGNPNEGVIEQIHPTDTPTDSPSPTTGEVETATEETTETTEEVAPAENATDVADGAAVSNTATANESNDAPAEETPDQKIARLESELADAKAATTQTGEIS